jgi:uncharacterized OB-fold protein
MTMRPSPTITPLTEPYWTTLGQGRLSFQRCTECGNGWLPPREHCPRCLSEQWRWETAGGTGKLISWVTYHVPYHPYFEDKLPYRVAVVELDEGPRMIAALPDAETPLTVDEPVTLHVAHDGDQPLAVFHPAESQ